MTAAAALRMAARYFECRRAVRDLTALDDAALRDIGLDRSEVLRAVFRRRHGTRG